MLSNYLTGNEGLREWMAEWAKGAALKLGDKRGEAVRQWPLHSAVRDMLWLASTYEAFSD